MVKVKICGIKDRETAIEACKAGADALGFVFAKSSRQITVNEAKNIIDKLPSKVVKIGVFVNESLEKMEYIGKECGLDYLQLHGNENPEICIKSKIPIIKAFRVATLQDIKAMENYKASAYLVDSGKGKYFGGNGTTFDWNIVKCINKSIKTHVILAGGLNCNNIHKAMDIVKPYAVDVSSGVETKGKKDLIKIRQFIKLVKER